MPTASTTVTVSASAHIISAAKCGTALLDSVYLVIAVSHLHALCFTIWILTECTALQSGGAVSSSSEQGRCPPLTVSTSHFLRCRALEGSGGALNAVTSAVTVENCAFLHNTVSHITQVYHNTAFVLLLAY
jgi:hypothetical protein